MPGCILGSFTSDWWGPRNALAYFVIAQAVVGYIMAGCYSYLYKPEYVGGFVVIYGLFLALGEAGPGDNIGLIASKTSATAIRGKYYGMAAAWGKIGAYIGTKTIGLIYDHYSAKGNDVKAGQIPFFIGASIALATGLLAIFGLPHIGQDTIDEEDAKFKAYLAANGYDVSRMGNGDSTEQIVEKGSAGSDEYSPQQEVRELK